MFKLYSSYAFHIHIIIALLFLILFSDLVPAQNEHQTGLIIGDYRYRGVGCSYFGPRWVNDASTAIQEIGDGYFIDHLEECSWEVIELEPWATHSEPHNPTCGTPPSAWYPRYYPAPNCGYYSTNADTTNPMCGNSRHIRVSVIGPLENDHVEPCSLEREDGINLIKHRYVGCPEGFDEVVDAQGDVSCVRYGDDPYKHNEPDCPTNGTNPINASQGYKIQTEHDYVHSSGKLDFSRHYSSNSELSSTSIGRNWRHNWDKKIRVSEAYGIRTLTAYRGNSNRYYFTSYDDGLSWESEVDIGMELVDIGTPTPGGAVWALKLHNGNIEKYNEEGQLVEVRYPDASRVTLSHGQDGLDEVEDESGRKLSFTYSGGRLSQVGAPSGLKIQFSYNSDDMLSTVTYGASGIQSVSKEYHYENSNYEYLLTGLTDELDNRVASWGYGSSGRASYSTQGEPSSNIGRYEISYNVVTGKVQHADITDPLGQERTYYFDKNKNTGKRVISAVSHPCSGCGGGVSADYEYTDDGLLVEKTDFEGNTTEYSHDSAGRITGKVEALATQEERTTTTVWNTDYNKPELITRGSYQQEYQYDAYGLPEVETERDLATAQARSATKEYYGASDPAVLERLLKEVHQPGGGTTQYEYYETASGGGIGGGATYRPRDLKKVINPEGHEVIYLSYNSAGQPTQVSNENGIVTQLEYHPRGWLLSTTTDGETTSYSYYPNGLVDRVTLADGSFIEFEYDDHQRLTAMENSLGERTEYDLDNAGNRVEEYIRDDSGTLKYQLSRVFTQLGRLEKRIDGMSNETAYTYDGNDNLDTVTDALNRTTDRDYDPLNRLKQSLDPMMGQTDFSYDEHDNLTSVTDPEGLTTDYTYNAFGDLLETDSPDTGITTYEYDADGNRTRKTDARNVVVEYDHDDIDRVISETYPGDTALNVTYEYDTVQPECQSGEQNPVGHLTKMIDSSGQTRFCYDARGNMTRKVQITDAETLELIYTYTAGDQVATITYPSDHTVTYSRDVAGQVTGITVQQGVSPPVVLIDEADYEPFGPIGYLRYGDGLEINYDYDLAYRIDEALVPQDSNLEYDYTQSAVGNITHIDEGGNDSRDLVYDDLDRLIEFRDPGQGNQLLFGFTYDDVGNRLTEQVWDGSSLNISNYTYVTGSHRLANDGSSGRSYDAAGNTTSGIEFQVGMYYDDRNRLDQITKAGIGSVTYDYNGMGQRVLKDSGLAGSSAKNIFAYGLNGQLLVRDTNPAIKGSDINEYIWLGNRPVGLIRNGKLYYIQSDHLGTPRRVISPSTGTVRWHWPLTSEPFGDAQPNEDPDSTGTDFEFNLRFPGQYYDAEFGLHYNYYRDYEPGTGRYVQSDPIGLKGGPDTYTYVNSNSLSYTDPYGLFKGSGPRDENPYWSSSAREPQCKDNVCNPPELPPCIGGYGKFRDCVMECSGLFQVYELTLTTFGAKGGSMVLERSGGGRSGFWRVMCGRAKKLLPLAAKASGVAAASQFGLCNLICVRYPCAMEID